MYKLNLISFLKCSKYKAYTLSTLYTVFSTGMSLTLEPITPREWDPIELMRNFNEIRHLYPKTSPQYRDTMGTPRNPLMERFLEDTIEFSCVVHPLPDPPRPPATTHKEDELRYPEVPSLTTRAIESLGNGPPSGLRVTVMGILTLSTFLRSLSISQMPFNFRNAAWRV